MKKTFTIILLLLSNLSFAQNLVPNPSFEIFDLCPDNLAQISRATGWLSFDNTPDYFNSCASSGGPISVSVPSNQWGFQYARTGNAYAGFDPFLTTTSNARECIGIQLNESLIIGQKYFASIYVSRAVTPHPYINVAINKIGVKLSTIAYYDSGSFNRYPIPIDNRAQVFTDSVITDTLNWVKISGSFIADSTYKYLSIGNFFKDSATSYIRFDSISTAAYYYVDDVYLSIDSINGMPSIYKNDLIKVIPNPARDWIVVEGRNISRLFLYNALGKICFSKEISLSSLERIDISTFHKGIYFLHVETLTESIIRKIILE